jgi:hypothetical protein
MTEFSLNSITSCCYLIKSSGAEVDYILGGYTSKLTVMDVV